MEEHLNGYPVVLSGGGGLKSVDFLFCIATLNLGAGGGGDSSLCIGVVEDQMHLVLYMLEEEASFSH